MKRAMKRFDPKVLRGYAATAVILLAVLTWPSDGWSKTSRHGCDVNPFVVRLLNNWAAKLAASTPEKPGSIVGTYAPDKPGPLAVLLPTCANGPSIGHAAIEEYFVEHFLANKPVVVGGFVDPTIGSDCNVAFASGLYTFQLNGGTPKERLLRARYTYIFRRGLITQHHSSLEPDTPANTCKPPQE